MADVPPDPIDARIQLLMGAVVGGFKGKPVTALSDEELVKASRFAEGMLRHGPSTEHPVARTLILAAHAEACVRIGQCLHVEVARSSDLHHPGYQQTYPPLTVHST